MFGLLFQSGYRIDDVFDMTLPQCKEVVQSIMIARARFVDALLAPVVAGLGEVSGSGAQWKSSTGKTSRGPGQKEADLLANLRASGIDID